MNQMMQLPERRINRFRNTPSSMKASAECFSRHAHEFGPHAYGEGFTPVSYQVVVPRVAILLFLCSPLAVAWFVIAIVVSAVNGVAFPRHSAHVLQESLERLPPGTDGDSAPTVVFVIAGVSVVAPAIHVHPCSVFRGPVAPMTGAPLGRGLPTEAAATLGDASGELVGEHPCFLAALTVAKPEHFGLVAGLAFLKSGGDNQAAKPAASEIGKCAHGSPPKVVRDVSLFHGSTGGYKWLP